MHSWNSDCQLVTHHSFSSAYPQTKSLQNILNPLLITTTALILFRSEPMDQEPCNLPNHSKLTIGWPGASCATSTVTTAIAKADRSTMDADHHDVIVWALASLAFKDASHTESSSCSWLGLRDECLDLSLQKCQKKYWSSLHSVLVVRQQEHELVKLTKQQMWEPPISLMCSLQFQLGSCDFLVTQHTRWQGGAEWGKKVKDGKEKSTNQSFFALLQA